MKTIFYRTHPFTLIAISILVGFLLGFLIAAVLADLPVESWAEGTEPPSFTVPEVN